MKRFIASLAVAALLAAFPVTAKPIESTDSVPALTQTVTTPSGFSVSLPADWAPITEGALDAYTASVQKAGVSGDVSYDYGYGLAANGDKVQAPCILVRVAETGAFPPDELKNLSGFDSGVRSGAQNAAQNLNKPVGISQNGSSVYDADNKVIWTDMTISSGAGKGTVHMALKLTSTGGVYFILAAPPKEDARYLALLKRIVAGVKLAPGKDYDPQAVTRQTPRTPDRPDLRFARLMGSIAGYCILGVILLFLIKLTMRVFRKKPQPGTPPQPPVE
jgi:hypothetical protein